MFPIAEFRKRLDETLEAMDALGADIDGDAAEALEETNAEFEDALMLFAEVDLDDEDADEALDDALTELEALARDYRCLAEKAPALAPLADRLAMTVAMAMENRPQSD